MSLDIGETMSDSEKFLQIVFDNTFSEEDKEIIYDIERQITQDMVELGLNCQPSTVRMWSTIVSKPYINAYRRGQDEEDIVLYPGAGAL